MNPQLMWELVDKPRWAIRLVFFAVLAAGLSTGSNLQYLYLFVLAGISLTAPAGDPFWVLGLTRRDYNLQRRVEIAVSAALLVVITVLTTDLHWGFIVGYLVIAGIVLVRNPRIPRSDRSRKGDLLAGTSGRTDDGHFPVTIEGQLVMRPQVKGWAYIVSVAALVSLLYWIISALFNNHWASGYSFMPVIASVIVFIVYEDTLATSLREYVAFGGTRKTWAQLTMSINSVVPGLLVVLGVVVPGWNYLSALGAAYLVLLLAIISLGLTTRSSWTVTIPVVAVAAALEVYVAIGIAQGSFLLPVLAALGGYIVGALLLPSMARKTNIYSGGLARWFGMAPVSR